MNRTSGIQSRNKQGGMNDKATFSRSGHRRQLLLRCCHPGDAARAARTGTGQSDNSAVVSKIMDGEYSNPARVVAFNIAEGWSRDVTEAIAQAVAERGRSENHFGKAAKGFVERTLGESVE
jgi:hypothetical protein